MNAPLLPAPAAKYHRMKFTRHIFERQSIFTCINYFLPSGQMFVSSFTHLLRSPGGGNYKRAVPLTQDIVAFLEHNSAFLPEEKYMNIAVTN